MSEFLFRWETLWYLMLFLYVPSCIGLIVVVLLQKGKGVGFAGAFGIGPGSDAVFGPRASRSLPQKLTHGMAAVFMVLAFAMSLISGRLGKGTAPERLSDQPPPVTQTDLSVLDDLGSQVTEETTSGTAEIPGATAPVPAAPESEAPAAPATPESATPAAPSAPASEAPAAPPAPSN